MAFGLPTSSTFFGYKRGTYALKARLKFGKISFEELFFILLVSISNDRVTSADVNYSQTWYTVCLI